jgi:hypothetical protein
MLRLPARVLSLETAQRYCVSDAASVRAKGDHVILEFRSDDEEGGEWIGEENGTLASVLPLRADLAGGDLRVLYLAWLLSAQLGELDDSDEEPSCPPGLGKLSAPLEAFVDFMRIDRDLIEVAAAASPELVATDDAALQRWVAALPESEKTALLVRLIGGGEAHLRAELLRRFRESRAPEAPPAKARTVGELLKAAGGARRSGAARRRSTRRAGRRGVSVKQRTRASATLWHWPSVRPRHGASSMRSSRRSSPRSTTRRSPSLATCGMSVFVAAGR